MRASEDNITDGEVHKWNTENPDAVPCGQRTCTYGHLPASCESFILAIDLPLLFTNMLVLLEDPWP